MIWIHNMSWNFQFSDLQLLKRSLWKPGNSHSRAKKKKKSHIKKILIFNTNFFDFSNISNFFTVVTNSHNLTIYHLNYFKGYSSVVLCIFHTVVKNHIFLHIFVSSWTSTMGPVAIPWGQSPEACTFLEEDEVWCTALNHVISFGRKILYTVANSSGKQASTVLVLSLVISSWSISSEVQE